jgi:D-amino-acid oxidase
MSASNEVLVIGAGVIGLTSAICAAEAGLPVQVRTAQPPQQTTSAAAGAMWGSSFIEPAADVKRWASESLQEFRALADNDRSGVRIARGTLASRRSSEPPPRELFPGVEIRASDELPAGFVAAFTAELPLIDMPRYLDYLTARLAAAGGAIEIGRIRDLGEAMEQASVVVNCTGIGARELVPDDTLRAVRGEHLIVENPSLDEFFMEEPSSEEWACFFPHGDRAVLGGNARRDDWSQNADSMSARAILERCAQIEPRLQGARVIEYQVGLRPARSIIRVECQRLGSATLLHNYGHGASGVSLSWGCARDVTAFALAS